MMKDFAKVKQAGVSIVDVIFAIFIFSVGVLGIAGLQMLSKKSNFEAVQRTTAVMLANDIVERMRANAGQLASYAGNAEPVTDDTEVGACTQASPCAPAQLAARDVWEWHQAIIGATDQITDANDNVTNTGGLVQPSACISIDATTNDVTVAIAWRSQTATSNPDAHSCGEDTGNYGNNNEFRQLFVLDVNINPLI